MSGVDLSRVMPCLDEAGTVLGRVATARVFLTPSGISRELVAAAGGTAIPSLAALTPGAETLRTSFLLSVRRLRRR